MTHTPVTTRCYLALMLFATLLIAALLALFSAG